VFLDRLNECWYLERDSALYTLIGRLRVLDINCIDLAAPNDAIYYYK
jgi:hypothetical protein